LLLGLRESDDAAVYRLSPDQALILTTDFFTPIVDTPFEYGAIAAANSLSDVYAMGGRPFLALNIAAFPPELPPEFLSEILRGGAEKVREAGAVVAGGHTVQDQEPKYGLVCAGLVHPERLILKSGARVGDALILSKPLGTGVIATAGRSLKARPSDLQQAVDWMKQLNNQASELARELGVRGGTDISGFGLLGHSVELAEASGVGLHLQARSVPFLEGADRYAANGEVPGGTQDNRRFFAPKVSFTTAIPEERQILLFDAQTSGGLLLCVPHHRLEEFQGRARKMSLPIWTIGEVISGSGIEIA
jgi:selenide,water dikinase